MSMPDIRRKPDAGGPKAARSRQNGRTPWDLGGEAASPVLAVVDLTTGCGEHRRRELVEAAHGASRMGNVVLLVRAEDRTDVDATLEEAAIRNGLGRAGVRCQVLDPRRSPVAIHLQAPSLVISDAPEPPSAWSGPGEVLPLDPGLRRLRELGRSPVFKGPDPVFRPLPSR